MAQPVESNAPDRLARIVRAHELLSAVSRQMSPAVDLETTLQEVIQAMRQLVRFRGGSICLAEDGLIRIAAADPEVSDDVMAARLPVGQGLAGRVVESNAVIYSPNLDSDDRVLPELRRLGTNAGIVSYLGVPLICLGQTIGLLQVDSPEVDAFDETDRILLDGLASQMANAIESARQIDEQRRLDGLKHAFIELVSHELRTPLTIASGMLRTYRDLAAVATAEQLEELLDRSQYGLSRLGRLIEELILMSELSAGVLEPRHEAFDARAAIDDVADRYRDEGPVVVHCTQGSQLVTDPTIAGRILEALLENALRYAGDAEITVEANTLTVRDHGPGLPDDIDVDDVTIFSRSRTNPTTISGLGLGLSMVTALAAEIGARFVLSSEPGAGTCATIDFGPRD